MPQDCNPHRTGRNTDFFGEYAVDLVVAVGAAVLDIDKPVISVGAMAKRRENHATCRDAQKDQGVEPAGAKNQVEVGACKCAHPVFHNNDRVQG